MRILRFSGFLALLLTLTSVALASGGTSVPSERPRLEDYDSQADFVRDVLAWERMQKQGSSAARNDGGREREDGENHDWHHITGPENLDQALRNAYGYVQPNYKEKYRYNRTTHLSFPLERLPSGQLSRQVISGGLIQNGAAEEVSLQPLPELRTILEETSTQLDPDDFTLPAELAASPGEHPNPGHRLDIEAR